MVTGSKVVSSVDRLFHPRQRLLSRLRDPNPRNFHRPPAGAHALGLRGREPIADVVGLDSGTVAMAPIRA
jgi:hypothetical protein